MIEFSPKEDLILHDEEEQGSPSEREALCLTQEGAVESSPNDPEITERGGQLHQVVGSAPLQRLQRFHHFQTVAHTPANHGVHTAEDGPRPDAQLVPRAHLKASTSDERFW